MICRHCGAVIDRRTWLPFAPGSAVVYAQPSDPGARTEWFRLDNDGSAANVCRKNAPSNAHEPR